ncbi:cell wall biosynthesis glycosyltransferase [candidate division WWE3 bacterium CG10_big_fil_rev_8_21_14_0_10_32_10]|uniref:Cell wall biosynthesis glycosyltransferase n=1 Tax=candidate division WWE3 bacterium CG10_big_fil_rev_8_21_14_0_10_32_10 TaxID=1975090 RepID=A0A2H0R9W6_UNCKA|nr:MAG: cell wall biosynthesis glycosyltransferase [candidate division WWE3 bacterium CG10_big_fil_rev_8_21_14_0_10_32_10]
MKSKSFTKLSDLSVFFPLYNEEKNIKPLVKECIKVFPKIAENFEIILINDGSTDKTRDIAKQLEKKYKNVRLVSQRNKGYGGAVKRGFKEAKYKWVFFSDGDLQFDLSEVKKFIAYTKNFDLVIGYRKNRAEGTKRRVIAKMLKLWNLIFLGFPKNIKDIDCAFKLIKKDAIVSATPLLSNGAMLTTEFLLKSHKKGFKIKQIGVKHYKRKYGNSTGSNIAVILRAVRDTFILRKSFFKSFLNSYTIPFTYKNI